jgi:hypothetical protein
MRTDPLDFVPDNETADAFAASHGCTAVLHEAVGPSAWPTYIFEGDNDNVGRLLAEVSEATYVEYFGETTLEAEGNCPNCHSTEYVLATLTYDDTTRPAWYCKTCGVLDKL